MDGEQEIDLPRNDPGRALIGDPRNDEHLIIAQLHLLFLRFHNIVVDRLAAPPERLAGRELFEEARRLVRWHYQWIVVHDFLPAVVLPDLAAAVVPQFVAEAGITAPTATRGLCGCPDEPIIPVEFSGAAFRFAHSLVRPDYAINKDHTKVPIFADPDAATAGDDEQPPHLGGFRRLPPELAIEWDRFFFDVALLHPPAQPGLNAAELIDESLARPLFDLPLRFTGGEVPASADRDVPPVAPVTIALARLNLHRGRALGLPSGTDVALAMRKVPLTAEQLFPPDGDPTPHVRIDATTRQALVRAPPLWYYVLREAAVLNKGLRLGPVGGRIVAEVLVGLLEGDPRSYLRRQPSWTPADCAEALALPEHEPIMGMADLVRFAAPPLVDTPKS
jgi:hypothetical protein